VLVAHMLALLAARVHQQQAHLHLQAQRQVLYADDGAGRAGAAGAAGARGGAVASVLRMAFLPDENSYARRLQAAREEDEQAGFRSDNRGALGLEAVVHGDAAAAEALAEDSIAVGARRARSPPALG
jgi:hypothetical protein